MNRIFGFSSFVSIILCIVLTITLKGALNVAGELQKSKYYVAKLQTVEHGLLNPNEWEKKITEKALNFSETGGMDRFVNQVIDYISYEVLDVRPQDGWAVSAAKTLIKELVHSKINAEDLKQFLQKSEEPSIYTNPQMHNTLAELGCYNKSNCISQQKENVRVNNSSLNYQVGIFIGLFFFTFVFALLSNKLVTMLCYIYATICMLLAGISLPILDIAAKIENFTLTVFDQQISFTEQFIMFESKSIYGVFQSLIENGSFESMLIAFLVVLFSIIFPFLKLFFSLIYAFNKSIANYSFPSFLIFKSAKWSMADVFVVAMFMSYLGLRSILHNELSFLNKAASNINVLTSENTSLQAGFLLFLIFAVTSNLMSNLIKDDKEVLN